MNRDDEHRLAAARLVAAERQPFLAVALYALSAVPAPQLGTFAVDERWRLYVDPAVLHEWSIEEVAAVLLHEVGHVVRDHAGRARRMFVDHTTAVLWNVAADAELNDDLRRDGLTLPRGGVLPSRLGLPAGRAAEHYYRELLERDHEHLPTATCGAGAHGVDPASDNNIARGSGDPVGAGVDEAEADLIRRQVALAVGRQAGTAPAGWSRWANGLLQPRVDWRRQLRAAVGSSLTSTVPGRTDYSYSRPSRRRIPGVVLPALVTGVPRAAVIIDTSGSVDDRLLERAWSESVAILRSFAVRREQVTVWAADTVAHRVNVRRGGRVELTGGGGTDMAAAMERAFNASVRPDVLIVLTDGMTPWPSSPMPCAVVVGLLRVEGWDPQVPSWATTVSIDR